MLVLITGGTGFIGSRLALRLLERGERVRVLGRRNNPAESETAELLRARGAEFLEASVTDPAALERALEDVDVVFHLAAAQHEAGVPDAYFRQINVEGTRNMLAAAEAAGVRRFVHGSTIGVYGSRPPEPVSEASALEPENIYGITKLEAERAVRTFPGKLSWTIARISETYGPGDRRLLKLFKGAARGLSLQIGPARNLHHLVYIDDLLDGLCLAAERPEAERAVFVLAGPAPVTTRDMLRAVSESLGARVFQLRVPLWPLLALAAMLETALGPLGLKPPLHRRRMDFFRKSFAFSNREARTRLGYDPKIDLATGMAATARWYATQGLVSSPAPPVPDATPREEPRRMHALREAETIPEPLARLAALDLEAKIEPFDSFWEGPSDIQKGYRTVYEFYRHNYLPLVPADREVPVLVVSCGPGYFVDMLVRHGYRNVVGIDSDPEKVRHATDRGLDCRVERAFPFLARHPGAFGAIFCEQELNHLTKRENLAWLELCREALRPGGTLIVHGLNGANPITGAEALAQNFDHYNTVTEYTLRQMLDHMQFRDVRVFPLHLYVFYRNPFNYVAWAAAATLSLVFRALFILYGKENKLFTKKIAAACRKAA